MRLSHPENISTPCHCSLLRKATRNVSQAYDTALAPSGLKLGQFSILASIHLSKHGPLSVNELAEIMVMDRSTLGQNLLPLERDGFIQLKKDSEDARTRRIYLTNKGLEKIKKTGPMWQEMQARFSAAFGADMESLHKMLLLLATTDFSSDPVARDSGNV